MKSYLLLISLPLLAACGAGDKKAATTTTETSTETILLDSTQVRMAGVRTGTAEQRALGEVLELQGTVDVPPQNIVSVSFPLGGYLQSTRLLPGMAVHRGESLGVIEDAGLVQLQQDYLVTRTRLRQLQLDLERQRSLNETKTAADKVLQQAEADYESSRIQLQGLAEKLRLVHIAPDRLSAATLTRKVSIPAPINGFVSKVNVNIGRYVQPQEVLFELINPEDIHAALTVFEKDLNKVKIGQRVAVRFVDEPGKTYAAEVLLITRNVDEHRSGTIHCHFLRMPPDLKPGMFLQATIDLGARAQQAVPEAAVVRYANNHYVFVEEQPGRYSPVAVAPGAERGGWVPVATPDLSGKRIVTANAYALLSQWKNQPED